MTRMATGFDKPLYVLPFDHRGTFKKNMFGWSGTLTAEQTAQISSFKQVIYEALQAAVAAGVPREKAGVLVDDQFGAAILRDAAKKGYFTALQPGGRRRPERAPSCPSEAALRRSSREEPQPLHVRAVGTA